MKQLFSNKRTLVAFLLFAVSAFIVAFAVRSFLRPMVVSGSSMNPILYDGDIVRFDSDLDDLEIGDVISFKEHGFRMIKRIVALPGDAVLIEDGVLYVNGEPSSFQFDPIEDPGVAAEELILSDDEYFCVGDNRNNSTDCREFGPISKNQIEHRITEIIYHNKNLNMEGEKQ